ncbi:MAG: hypothetical protein [Caudoviricetes sp.]|nr:MAG: hypothetical protein [Caudoviricetes sp.]
MALQTALKTEKKVVTKRIQQEELAIDNYPCRVAQVIDLGLHHKEEYDTSISKYVPNMEKAPVNMLMVTYEFTTEFLKDENGEEQEDKPRWLSEQFPLYPLDSDLATSTKRYNAFDPGASKFGGDWSKIAGEPCAVTIAHKGNHKAKIGNVAKPMKGMVVPDLKNPIKTFDLSEPDLDIFNSLPTWLQDKIKANLEYPGSPLQALLEGGVVKVKDDKTKQEKAPVEVPVEGGAADDVPW